MPGARRPAAAALVGRGLADAHRLEPRHARARREARHAHQAGVDHDAHALDGEARLRDRGREHHLAPAGRRRRDREVLLGGREISIERRHIDVGAEIGKPLLNTADLADARQENERAAVLSGDRPPHRARRRILDAADRVAVEIARLDREHAAGRFDQRRAAEPFDDGAGIERRRHRDHAQILAQRRLRLAHQGEGEIAFQPALVQLVEDHAADAVERGIVLQQAQEEAVGDDLDARARTDLRVEPHAVAHGLADRLAQRRRHAARRRARRQPPRLLHHDLAAAEPGCIEQRQRHARRLAGARRRDEDRGIAPGQHRLKLGQRLVDGKGGNRHAPVRYIIGARHSSGAHDCATGVAHRRRRPLGMKQEDCATGVARSPERAHRSAQLQLRLP